MAFIKAILAVVNSLFSMTAPMIRQVDAGPEVGKSIPDADRERYFFAPQEIQDAADTDLL
ncbi:hypothetical protein [Pseudomonas sp. dw_358]|uniref:hypothetical protein n=1 Tax=Pseudomonas sp. dw_358 TaxID=2720083 RepID=UPI001BD6B324|nr:hypothetical protein [Pseudomonas sp. dw_358]